VGVIQLATVTATSNTDRNVHLSVDVGQLNVILLFDNGTCTGRIFIRVGFVLVPGSLFVVNICPASADRISPYSRLFT
jgi:hypothetical protein